MIIQDGTGKGYSAKVDSNNHLHTQCFTEEQRYVSALHGGNYNLTTGSIALTAGESAVFYFKSGEEKVLLVDAIRVYIGNPATAGNFDATLVKNPTAGTIVSGASAGDINQNKNFGSSNVLSSNSVFYKGADGNTFTDGTDADYGILAGAGIGEFGNKVVINPGNSLGIKVSVPSNTSIVVRVDMHFIDGEIYDI